MGDFAAAFVQLEAAQKKEPEHGQVQYFLALCHTRQGRPQEALPLLHSLSQRDPRWSNYLAWHLLIETHETNGNSQAALDTCRQLVNLSPTLENKCLLAEHLLDAAQNGEARRLLEGALQDHHFAPGPIRRRNRRWAGEARRLLKRMP
jgi:predicted Zn-dependent protease